MAYWVKIRYERNEYIINLDKVSAFVCAPNGRIKFWVPDSNNGIIVNHHSNREDYQQVLNYIDQVTENSLTGTWLKVFYDRCEYFIDLNRISTFSYAETGKLTFWLTDSKTPIVITPQANPEEYDKILKFVFNKTGFSL